MRRVMIESPYAGDIKTNEAYLRLCLRDSLARGEAPFASHAIYPQVLNDGRPDERRQGIGAGSAWRIMASATIVYSDLGVSSGMLEAIQEAKGLKQPIEYRLLGV